MINELRQQEKLECLNVKVIELPIEKGFTTIVNGQRYIAVSSYADPIERYWIIEHELMHLTMNNLYDKDTNEAKIRQIEYYTNTFMVLENGLIEEMTLLLSDGASREDIKSILCIDDDIFDIVLRGIIRTCMEEVYG